MLFALASPCEHRLRLLYTCEHCLHLRLRLRLRLLYTCEPGLRVLDSYRKSLLLSIPIYFVDISTTGGGLSSRIPRNSEKAAFHSKTDGQRKRKEGEGIFSLENNKEPCVVSSSVPGTAGDLQQTSEHQKINRKPEIDVQQNDDQDDNKTKNSCETECDFLATDKKDETAAKTVEEQLSTAVVLEDVETSSSTMPQLVDENSASNAEPHYNILPEETLFNRFDGCDKTSEGKHASDVAQREMQEPRMFVSDEVITRDMAEEASDIPLSKTCIRDMKDSTNLDIIDVKGKKKTPDPERLVTVDMFTTASLSIQEVTSLEEKPVIADTTCEDNPFCAPHAITSPSKGDAQQTHKKGEHDDVQARGGMKTDKQSSAEAVCNLTDFSEEDANTSQPATDQDTDVHNKHSPTQDDRGKVLTSSGSNEENSPSLNDLQDMAFTLTHGEERMNGKVVKAPSQEEFDKQNQGNCTLKH